jgi:hypothetical protein
VGEQYYEKKEILIPELFKEKHPILNIYINEIDDL